MSNKPTIKALQTFVDTWAPVVEAVPAVIRVMDEVDYYENQKAALQNDISTLLGQFEAAKSTWREAEVAWERNIAELQAGVAKANQALSDANAEAKKAVAAANKRAAEAEKLAGERVEAANMAASVEREKLRLAIEEAKSQHREEMAALAVERQKAENDLSDARQKLEAFKASLSV